MGVRPVLTEGAHLRPAWRPGDTRAEGQLVVGMGAGPSSLACPILSLHSWSVVRVTAKVSTQNLLGASPAPNTSRGRLLCRRMCLSRVDRTPFSLTNTWASPHKQHQSGRRPRPGPCWEQDASLWPINELTRKSNSLLGANLHFYNMKCENKARD